MEELLDKQAVAEALGTSVRSIERLCASGELAYVRVGAGVRFRPSDVEHYIREHRTYRHQRDGEVVISGADIADGFTVDVRQERPDRKRYPKMEWYCHNSDCAVREVTVACKYLAGPPPAKPAMNCPECGKPMRFAAYLEEMLLLPVRPSRPETVQAQLLAEEALRDAAGRRRKPESHDAGGVEAAVSDSQG